MSIEVRKCSGGMISTEIIIMTKTISVNTVIGPNESVLYKTRCQTISNFKKNNSKLPTFRDQHPCDF